MGNGNGIVKIKSANKSQEKMTKLSVKNLDHLGIIAAIVDELGIVDYINEQL